MTRSNLYVTLSNGKEVICVAESTSAPEQGYFVEDVLLPLFKLTNHRKELSLLRKTCTMHELRANAYYRYYINLITKEVQFFEENYNDRTDEFYIGKDLTFRYLDYLKTLKINQNEN